MNYREAINTVSGCRYIHTLTADKVETVYFRRGARVYSLLGSSVGWSINREESLAATVTTASPVRALDESVRLVIAMAEVLEAVSENDTVRAEHNDRQIARIDGLLEKLRERDEVLEVLRESYSVVKEEVSELADKCNQLRAVIKSKDLNIFEACIIAAGSMVLAAGFFAAWIMS